MIGLPGRTCHLEFTTHRNGSDGTAPSRDNLLVFYVPDAGQLARARQRLEALGHRPVTPENPYWLDKSVTFEDPGWLADRPVPDRGHIGAAIPPWASASGRVTKKPHMAGFDFSRGFAVD